MFKLFEKKTIAGQNRFCGEIYATQDGVAMPRAKIPDAMIREGLLGEGIAILPKNGRVLSPVDGIVSSIVWSKHAFCLHTSDGADVLVHIGIDTVTLNGQGFHPCVERGEYVLAGAPICEVDLPLLAEKNLLPHTAILILNADEFSEISVEAGEVSAGASCVIRYKPK